MTSLARGRRVFGIGLWRFRVPRRFQDALIACLTTVADGAIYLIGPILICFALVIATGLSYTFFAVMLPMLQRAWSTSPYQHVVLGLHISYVIFILINVMYNYFMCVITSNKGNAYERVVRELADATGFDYPEFPDEVAQCKRDYEDRMILRMERRRARRAAASNQGSNNTAVPTGAAANSDSTVTQRRGGGAESSSTPAEPPRPTIPKGSWMLMGPQEWGFCPYSNQPKPPRSHYDHVTKTLVLNMDHFCPWMFNTIGYFNYRYFCNFLLYVFLGMFYGAVVSFRPFCAISYQRGRTGNNLWAPAREDEAAIAFSFMLCLSVGLAVLSLGGFHAYLILTAQTTIEFHGNYTNKRRARQRGTTWVNPYDLGMRQNWQQVYGTKHPLRALLPSSRGPEFLPIPIDGKLGRRRPKSKEEGASAASGSLETNGLGIV